MSELIAGLTISNLIGMAALWISFNNFRENRRNSQVEEIIKTERRLALIEESIKLLRNDFNNVSLIIKERISGIEKMVNVSNKGIAGD